MRLQDKHEIIALQLKDLYDYERFLKERITKLEGQLTSISKLLDFACYLDTAKISIADLDNIVEQSDEPTESPLKNNYEI